MDQNVKQQAVEQVKRANNVLVTVSANPSVDQLSAALGLTLMLTKMGKHATAVVSGEIPPAISFLDPSKTFTNSVDGLRDFIIALDKEKADKLRYKVENDVVRIFITPYDGEISEKDLQFSQGDFNVDVVVALGVSNREDIDNAIKAHGRILHDATVVTINAGSQKSDLGAVDWHDASASSLCEMMVSVSEAFQGGLLDSQISTALLTGIDAATNRFSNSKTSPKILTMAAQLMAAGANQQLIANNLTPDNAALVQSAKQASGQKGDDSELKLDHSENEEPIAPPANLPLDPAPVAQAAPPLPIPEPLPAAAAALPPVPVPDPLAAPALPDLNTQSPPVLPPAPEPEFPAIIPDHVSTVPKPVAPSQIGPEPGTKSVNEIEDEISALATTPGVRTDTPTQPEPAAGIEKKSQTRLADPNDAPTMQQIEDARNAPGSIVGQPGPTIGNVKGQSADLASKPILGGTFNATANDAHDEVQHQIDLDKNSAILNHAGKGDETTEPPADAPSQPAIDVDDARAEVEQAMNSAEFDPANHPVASLNATPLGPAVAPQPEPAAPAQLDPDVTLPTEINIDPNGHILPAAPAPMDNPPADTLSIPGVGMPASAPTAPAAPGGMPPLASDSLDAPPPLPSPPPQ